jgi:ABC-type branched-subunit amino acid transport system ATPase component/branched-subunit amino acid ABC-type transport system permease component
MNVLAAGSVLPFLVSGIATGSIFALAAVGLVLTYKTSGIFNFGHGAVATAAAYVFFFLHSGERPRYWVSDNSPRLHWSVAFVAAVFVVGPLLGLLMERIARRLTPQSASLKISGTIGLILMVQGLGTIQYGTDARNVDPFLPKGNDTFRLGGVVFLWNQVWVAGISLVAVAGLYVLFRSTRLGVAMQAVVDDPDLLDLQGTSPIRIRRISWIIGSVLAALSGVLLITFVGMESITLTFLVVLAFGAAAIGSFSSIPLTFLGGLVVGVVSDVTKKRGFITPWLYEYSNGLPFLVLFLALLLIPKRKLLTSTAHEVRPPLQWKGPWQLRLGFGILMFGFLAFIPNMVSGSKLIFWSIALVTIIEILALGLLVRTAGLVSLCSAMFAGIGAATFSQFVLEWHLPYFVAIALAGLVAAIVGAIVAIPTIRLSGLFLALGTLGFGVFVERAFYGRGFLFTTLTTGREMPRPSFAHSDEAYYRFILVVVVVVILAVSLIHRGRLGRILRGLGDAPTAVSTLGLNTAMTRVIVFCIAAFLTAVAGILYGSQVHAADAGATFFNSFTSLTLIAVLALAPMRDPWFAIFAGVTQVIPAYLHSANTGNWLIVVFGFFALRIAMEGGHQSMARKFRPFFARIGPPERPKKLADSSGGHRRAVRSGGLNVQNLTVRFGGLVAVNDVTLEAPTGRITGLIGPNGAGKTTTFNSCSGLNKPSAGTVTMHGKDLGKMAPGARARHGIGRSFQIMQLAESLTVRENVALGCEASQAGSNLLGQFFASPSDQRTRRLATDEAMTLCGIQELAELQAGALSTGQRRLVELARCLAGPFDVLLLDEPSSGLDHSETVAFGALLQRVVAERGCGILLVEHDMSLVMEICQYIYVLDFGQVIFDGTPSAVRTSPVVRQAYLGEEIESDVLSEAVPA